MITRSTALTLRLSRARHSATRSFSPSTVICINSKHDDEEDRVPFIPKPTWSIKSLELTSNHEKLAPEEMQRLSQRALLNLNELPQDLEQDLANMMHMIQTVSEFVTDPSNKQLFNQDDETGAFQYDLVRGVTAAPLRGTKSPPDPEDVGDSAQVWEKYLEQKTIRRGGSHKYFAISTKQSEEK